MQKSFEIMRPHSQEKKQLFINRKKPNNAEDVSTGHLFKSTINSLRPAETEKPSLKLIRPSDTHLRAKTYNGNEGSKSQAKLLLKTNTKNIKILTIQKPKMSIEQRIKTKDKISEDTKDTSLRANHKTPEKLQDRPKTHVPLVSPKSIKLPKKSNNASAANIFTVQEEKISFASSRMEEELNLKPWGMCSKEEGLLREKGQALSIFERAPGSDYKIKPEWAIKAYERSSPGDRIDKPLEITTLKKIIEYITNQIVDLDHEKSSEYPKPTDSENFNFWDIYCFVSDRFRSVNKDITMLGNKADSRNKIEILEKMIRFFIISIHEGSKFPDSFNPRLNMERLSDFLTNLIACYNRARNDLISICGEQIHTEDVEELGREHNIYISPNEAEFLSYKILFQHQNPFDFTTVIGKINEFEDLIYSREISDCMELVSNMREMNVYKYFEGLKISNYLRACALSFYYEKMLELSKNLFKNENIYLALPAKYEYLRQKYTGLRRHQLNKVSLRSRYIPRMIKDRYLPAGIESNEDAQNFKGNKSDFVCKIFQALIETVPKSALNYYKISIFSTVNSKKKEMFLATLIHYLSSNLVKGNLKEILNKGRIIFSNKGITIANEKSPEGKLALSLCLLNEKISEENNSHIEKSYSNLLKIEGDLLVVLFSGNEAKDLEKLKELKCLLTKPRVWFAILPNEFPEGKNAHKSEPLLRETLLNLKKEGHVSELKICDYSLEHFKHGGSLETDKNSNILNTLGSILYSSVKLKSTFEELKLWDLSKFFREVKNDLKLLRRRGEYENLSESKLYFCLKNFWDCQLRALSRDIKRCASQLKQVPIELLGKEAFQQEKENEILELLKLLTLENFHKELRGIAVKGFPINLSGEELEQLILDYFKTFMNYHQAKKLSQKFKTEFDILKKSSNKDSKTRFDWSLFYDQLMEASIKLFSDTSIYFYTTQGYRTSFDIKQLIALGSDDLKVFLKWLDEEKKKIEEQERKKRENTTKTNTLVRKLEVNRNLKRGAEDRTVESIYKTSTGKLLM